MMCAHACVNTVTSHSYSRWLQINTAFLTALKDKASSGVTIDEIKLAITYTRPAHPKTAKLFCWAMNRVAYCGKSFGCDKIASAGGIPVIAQLLARFPDDNEVVRWSSLALSCIDEHGSAAAKAEIRKQPRLMSLLAAASARFGEQGPASA